MKFTEGVEHVNVRRTPAREGQPIEAVQHLILEMPKKISGGGNLSLDGVYQVMACNARDREGKLIPVVVKAYSHWNQNDINYMSVVHKEMRERGFKVPRTLRFDSDRKITLMTDFNGEDHIALSSNNPASIEAHSLSELSGFEDVAREILEEAIRAGVGGYSVPVDSYFLLVPTNDSASLDFIIGDLDGLARKGEKGASYESIPLVEENLSEAMIFLRGFLHRWLTDGAVKQYARMVTAAELSVWSPARQSQVISLASKE